MSFVRFCDLPAAEQERVALAPRPRIHLEPLTLARAGTDETMPALHLQVGDGHALMLIEDVQQFRSEFVAAIHKLTNQAKARPV